MNHLNLCCDKVALGTQLRTYIEQRVDQAIARLKDKVNDVNLKIEDINGPDRKGLDKQARLVVRWRNKQSLVIEDRDSKLGVLIHRLMDRLEASIERRSQKLQDKRKGFRRNDSYDPNL
jgi:ribosome-associated translation inhibitor RaiA